MILSQYFSDYKEINNLRSITWVRFYENERQAIFRVFAQAQNRIHTQAWPPHHALADGRALMTGYRAWREFIQPIWSVQ